MDELSGRYQAVCERITQAALQAGRKANSVQLLAVSKTFGADAVIEAVRAGQTAFGENYIQEGVDKILALRQWLAEPPQAGLPALQWHCIGPIQSNKTRLVQRVALHPRAHSPLAGLERARRVDPMAKAPAWFAAGDRCHGLGQVHHLGRHAGPPQPHTAFAHPHFGRPH